VQGIRLRFGILAIDMKHRLSAGFTIVETLLFLSISMLLVLIVVVGQGSVMARTRYRDAIEGVESQIVQIQEELRSTINGSATSSSGTNVNEIILGKVVVFIYGDPDFRIYDCLADRANGPMPPSPSGALSCDFTTPVKTISIRAGAVPVSLSDVKTANATNEGIDTLLFFRHHLNGDVHTVAYNRTASGVSPLVAVQNMLAASYGTNTAPYRELALRQLPQDYRAVIRINYADGATIGTDSTGINQIDKQYLF
jgi:type II secretory pathway pseudopilin PulG